MKPNIRYIRREHLADVTEIYNKLKWEKKKRLFKVAYLVAVFVMSVVRYYIRNAFFCELSYTISKEKLVTLFSSEMF